MSVLPEVVILLPRKASRTSLLFLSFSGMKHSQGQRWAVPAHSDLQDTDSGIAAINLNSSCT